MKHVYSCIDIGTDTIKLVVCELYKNKLNLLATSSVKAKGIKRGLITDVEQASISIRQAFQEVEEMLGIRISKVIAMIPSYFADFVLIKGSIPITGDEGMVTGNDIIDVLQAAMQEKLKPNKEMVTIIPIDFSVDEKTGIKEPKGLVGSTLSTRAIMVTTPRKNIVSVVGLLDQLGIEAVDVSLNGIGDIYAFKTPEMDGQIGAVVNIGYETTSVSVYNKDIIVKNSIIGMGGKNIDHDIAYMYKVDIPTANRVKEKFALAHKKNASVNDTYEIKTQEGDLLKINQFEVSEIAMSRIEEILVLAQKEINLLTNKKIEYLIITGGTSNMMGFDLTLKEVLGSIAMIGDVRLIGIRNNKYSSCVGNIVYFINKLKLKGTDYTMISHQDAETLSSTKKNLVNVSNDSMLGKVFGYFFGE